MSLYVDYTAVNVDDDRFEITTIKQLLEDSEIDFSEHKGCFVAEGLKKIWIPFQILSPIYQTH